jgi:hypothetical protein
MYRDYSIEEIVMSELNRIVSVVLGRYLTLAGLWGGGVAIYQFSMGEYLSAALIGVPSLALLGWLTYNSIRNNFG